LASSIARAIEEMEMSAPDVVILDLTLPDGDGLDLCRLIRERSNAYVLMLTGRDDEVDKLLGFRLGADDYMTKPFSARELAARVDALLRRPRVEQGTEALRTFGDLAISTSAREVTVAGVVADLTRIEFDLLDVLSANPKVVYNRQQLLDRVWGPGWFGDDHVVDVHIANLRKKIDQPGTKSLVRTVRGVGYSMGG
jgi:DNA-binding response OmpR family regulator